MLQDAQSCKTLNYASEESQPPAAAAVKRHSPEQAFQSLQLRTTAIEKKDFNWPICKKAKYTYIEIDFEFILTSSI